MADAAALRALAVQGKLGQNAEVCKGGTIDALNGYALEPKFDGWRLFAVILNGVVELFTRGGNQPPGDLPKVKAELLANFPSGTILDGEAVALTMQDGLILNEWSTAQSVLTTIGGHAAADKVTFMVFDLIAHRGIDARALAWGDRRVLLERIFDRTGDSKEGQPTLLGGFEAVALSTTMEATDANHDALVKAGFEGSMLKRVNAPYASGKRGAGWLKVKPQTTIDVIVTGFKPGENSFAGLIGAIEFGQHDPDTGALIVRGRCSGMDMRTRLEITQNQEKWMGRVIEIAHMGADVGKNGSVKLRHPQFKRWRKDKAPELVVMHDA